jgi:hypothetical protein
MLKKDRTECFDDLGDWLNEHSRYNLWMFFMTAR